jgi:hypothetical protein
MPKRNRHTLKNYFTKGALPTAAYFADFVDSTLNMMDDGFSRSPANGVEITLLGDERRLMSFFGDSQVEVPDWAITCAAETNSLNFVRTGPQDTQTFTTPAGPELELLTLTRDGKVGVHVADPVCRLDVDGTVRSTGRFGHPGFVPADGAWHAITEPLDGCNALEVIAGVGLSGEKKGRYAMLHAIALNTFNPTGFFFNFLNLKKRIKCSHAWYLGRGDRLKLRWVAVDSLTHQYQLQLRVARSYGDGVNIQYSITTLWSDVYMTESKRRQGGGQE